MRLTVYKAERRLILLGGVGERLHECAVSLGFSPVGPKRAEGDGKTPEGEYRIVTKNPKSKFHLSLGISYPNASDARRAFARGEISESVLKAILRADMSGARPPWDTPLGGFIMLHGEARDAREGDWTAGCIAMQNADIERLFALCDIGVEIRILP